MARALYFGCAFLCSFVAWALPTVRMSRDIQYFLKTGLGRPTAGFTIMILLAFESCLLAGMFLILSIFEVPGKAGGSFFFRYRLIANLAATGLAKTILLMVVPSIPVWEL